MNKNKSLYYGWGVFVSVSAQFLGVYDSEASSIQVNKDVSVQLFGVFEIAASVFN